MMTVSDVLAAVKAHLSGDGRAGLALADAFEEGGDPEGAALARSGSFAMAFDTDGAFGKVTFLRGGSGPEVFLDAVAGVAGPLARLDLSPGAEGEEPAASLYCFDAGQGGWRVACEFGQGGGLVVRGGGGGESDRAFRFADYPGAG
jgi:hypothetical protein